MAIKYKVIKQGATPLTQTNKSYYTARACKRSLVGLDEIAELLSLRSTLSKADVFATLIALTEAIPEYLLNNQSVQLGDLGTVSLHLSSKSESTPEDVTWRSIKELKVQFRAGKEIKKSLKSAHFKKVTE